jgi:hypothetical protein
MLPRMKPTRSRVAAADTRAGVTALETLLANAATASRWSSVVHRCAWCGRVARPDGSYAPPRRIGPATVVSDGMCSSCGARALREIAARRTLQARLVTVRAATEK